MRVILGSTFLTRASLVGIASLLVGWCVPAHAQRVTTMGGSVDVSAGVDNYPINTTSPGTPAVESSQSDDFYGVSPAVTVSSRTARADLSFSYAFGWNHFGSESPRNTTSHAFSLSWSRQMNQRWSLRLGESYSRTNDLYTFNALRGVAIDEETIVLFFYPTTTHTSIGTNSLSVAVDRTLSPRSQITFGGGHSIGIYGDSEGALVGLSNLQTFTANASYTRRFNDRTSWNVGYSGSYFSFDKFNSAVANAVTVGLSSTVAKNTTLNISVGPSQVNNLNIPGSNSTLTAFLSVSHKIKENSLYFSIGNNNATTTGVGSVSSTRSANAGISRPFGRRVTVFGDFSAYDGTGIVGNPYNTRGVSATGNMGFTLVKNLSVHGGVQFQRYIRPAPYAFTQRRAFVSLRYSVPNLLRSH